MAVIRLIWRREKKREQHKDWNNEMVIKVMDFIVLVSILYPILDHTPSLSLPGWVDFLFAHEKNGNRESLNRSNFQLLALFCYCSNRSILIKCPPGNNRFQAGVMFGYRITMKLALKSKHLKIYFFFVLFIICRLFINSLATLISPNQYRITI